MSADRETILRDGAQAMGLSLTDAQSAQLLAYGELILKWNKVYNLTALRDPAQVLTHHLLDSLSIIAPTFGVSRSSLERNREKASAHASPKLFASETSYRFSSSVLLSLVM